MVSCHFAKFLSTKYLEYPNFRGQLEQLMDGISCRIIVENHNIHGVALFE